MKKLTDHIIALANQHNLPITNLQLQLVTYFTFKKILEKQLLDPKEIKELYQEPFYLWRYGPTLPAIKERYSFYQSDPIVDNPHFQYQDPYLNYIIIGLIRQSDHVFKFVEQSHRKPFYQEHESKIQGWRSNIQYKLSDIYSKN